MIADPAWLRRNDDYLGAALVQLRHRLNAATPPTPAAAAPRAKEAARAGALWRSLVGGVTSAHAEAMSLLPPQEGAAPAIEEKRLADAVEAAAAGERPPAVVALSDALGLAPFERDLLILCLGFELDPGLAQRMPGRGQPHFALAVAALPDPTWDALAPDRPLRHWRLVEVDRSGGRPLTSSPLSVDERILNFAKGLDHLDARLAALVHPLPAWSESLAASQVEAAAALEAALDPEWPAVAMLRGADRSSKQDVAQAAAAARGLALYRLAADVLPADLQEIDQLARLWHRETLLMPAALLLDAHDVDRDRAAPDGLAGRVARFVRRTGGPLIVDTRSGLSLPVPPLIDREIFRPTTAEQIDEWRSALGDTPGAAELARRMASRFDLDRAGIAGAVRTALAEPASVPLAERLQQATLARTRAGLARLAERVDVKAGFGDIVLPQAQEAQLRQLVAQVEHRITVLDDWGFAARMNRGLGVSALFAGESGTGKTMAAEVIANALGLDLYRIDLSAVVSKYIGETEKNLGILFDAADLGGAVLLFDEADALFGKRSEVKEAHDRFANIEIDYLLQRMESYRGVAILTTNQKSALDSAFTRRLRFIIDFPYPGPAERERIWEHAFPKAVKVEGFSAERLARLDLTGAGIQSVALNAAFLAAERGTEVTMPLIMEAGRAEFRKFDRPINEADFRPVEPARAGP